MLYVLEKQAEFGDVDSLHSDVTETTYGIQIVMEGSKQSYVFSVGTVRELYVLFRFFSGLAKQCLDLHDSMHTVNTSGPGSRSGA